MAGRPRARHRGVGRGRSQQPGMCRRGAAGDGGQPGRHGRDRGKRCRRGGGGRWRSVPGPTPLGRRARPLPADHLHRPRGQRVAGGSVRPTGGRRRAAPRRAAGLPCLLPPPPDDRAGGDLVLGRRGTGRSRLRRALRDDRRQQRPACTGRCRLPRRHTRATQHAGRVQPVARPGGPRPPRHRRPLRRCRRRPRGRQHGRPVRRHRGLGPGQLGQPRRHPTDDAHHDPARRLHAPRRSRAPRRAADPRARLQVHLLRHVQRRRRRGHAGGGPRLHAHRLDPLDRGPRDPTDVGCRADPLDLRGDGRHVLHAGVARPIPRRRRTPTTALGRLTASGTDPFDSSADIHSIGAGFFDPEAARDGDEATGNVPIEIAGIPVANLLSFHYPSRYSLDGGAVRCDDLRAGCASG